MMTAWRCPGWLERLTHHPSLVIGLLILLFWAACAAWAPAFVPTDPYATDPMQALLAPNGQHWFGTDQLGRDILSRVLVGARDVLITAPAATLLGTVAGTALGLVSGYLGGWVDRSMGWVLNAIMALPLVVVGLFVLATLGTSTGTMILVIGSTFAPITARTVRAAVVSERHQDYVRAAQATGEGALRIMLVEVLPNIMVPIVVEAAVRLGYAVFTVATLSFLGFGTQPPSPDWGLSLSENYTSLAGGAWWTVAFSGAAIASLIIAVNLVADGLQDLVQS